MLRESLANRKPTHVPLEALRAGLQDELTGWKKPKEAGSKYSAAPGSNNPNLTKKQRRQAQRQHEYNIRNAERGQDQRLDWQIKLDKWLGRPDGPRKDARQVSKDLWARRRKMADRRDVGYDRARSRLGMASPATRRR